jgi:hypothetical protein
LANQPFADLFGTVGGAKISTIQVTADLVLESWPGSDVDRSIIKLRSQAQESDGETPPGVLIVYLDEVLPLVAALVEAAAALAEETVQGPRA